MKVEGNMTDIEKKVMVRLCTKILTETELYEMDMEVRNLVDWICLIPHLIDS